MKGNKNLTIWKLNIGQLNGNYMYYQKLYLKNNFKIKKKLYLIMEIDIK
jgi:hypothetical protein